MMLADMVAKRLRGSSAMRGTMWTTLGFGLTYALRLLSTLVLTRLLAPDIFGLMGLAAIFLTGAQMLSDIGVIPSVIRSSRGDEPVFLQSAWTVQVIRGLAITVVLCLLAWPVSRLYGEPQMTAVLCVLSLVALMRGFDSIGLALCRRRMQLGRVTTLELVTQATVIAVSVLVAWSWPSVWALVIGNLAGGLARLAVSHLWMEAPAHRFRAERAALREIVRFGRWIFLGTLLTYLGGKGSKALIALFISLETLGLINIATTLSWALGDLASKVLNNVVFPSLARVWRDDPDRLGEALGRVKRLILVGVIPGFLLLSLAARPLVELMYDPRYAESGDLLRLYALNGAISTLAMPYQNAFLAMGNSRVHSMVMLVTMLARILGIVAGAHFFGTYGMITGLGLGALTGYLLSLFIAGRHGLAQLLYDGPALALIGGLYVYNWFQIAGA